MRGPQASTIDTLETLDLYGGWKSVRGFANDTATAHSTMVKRVLRMAKQGLVETRTHDGQLQVRPNPERGGQ